MRDLSNYCFEELINVDFTDYTEDELVELRDKCNAQIARLRNTGKKHGERIPHRRRYYKFLDKEEANRFYFKCKDILGDKFHDAFFSAYVDGKYNCIVIDTTKENSLKIIEDYEALPDTRVFRNPDGGSKIFRIGDTYICKEKKDE